VVFGPARSGSGTVEQGVAAALAWRLAPRVSMLRTQGVLERNIPAFDPGWASNVQTLDSYTDVRELQRWMKAQGHA
jgi:hypothetical protein